MLIICPAVQCINTWPIPGGDSLVLYYRGRGPGGDSLVLYHSQDCRGEADNSLVLRYE